VIELCRRAAGAGLIVLCPFAAPSAESRERWRAAVGAERWLEVALEASAEVRKARAGGGFYAAHPEPTYEAPRAPALVLQTEPGSSEAAGRRVVELLEAQGVFGTS
jgi:adenylylsulfate kinase-like enzyme